MLFGKFKALMFVLRLRVFGVPSLSFTHPPRGLNKLLWLLMVARVTNTKA
jgi:hypothetical protein